MLSSWVRWLLIGTVGLAVSMYAMDTVRVASTLPIPTSAQAKAKETQKDRKKPANAIAKASQMDKVADALAGN